MSVDICIIGSGPAGYTASIYAGRANLNTVLFQGSVPGGQLVTTDHVENFPGFPDGISGMDLCERMESQSAKYGTRHISDTVLSVDLSYYPYTVKSEKETVTTRSIIIATGAFAKTMTFPGSDLFWNKGISACAVCDGALPLFRKQPVAVVGGGDSAMEEALYMTKFASTVYLIHRRNTFRASAIMQERVKANPLITILYEHEIVRAEGSKHLEYLIVKDGKEHEHSIRVNGLFYAIGHTPATSFLNGQLPCDDKGYLVSNADTSTSIPGVFVAGDVTDHMYRQAITAAGKGCQAALEAISFLSQ
jgi:thioredoxin reductase (NADPH)